jgi:hypothetical protein
VYFAVLGAGVVVYTGAGVVVFTGAVGLGRVAKRTFGAFPASERLYVLGWRGVGFGHASACPFYCSEALAQASAI